MANDIHPVLERVAKAIALANHPLEYIDWDAYLPDAGAAIQALMEPDEGQSRAGQEVDLWRGDEEGIDHYGAATHAEVREIYQAMLKPLLGDEG